MFNFKVFNLRTLNTPKQACSLAGLVKQRQPEEVLSKSSSLVLLHLLPEERLGVDKDGLGVRQDHGRRRRGGGGRGGGGGGRR